MSRTRVARRVVGLVVDALGAAVSPRAPEAHGFASGSTRSSRRPRARGLRVRALDIRLLSPGGTGAGVKIHRARLRRTELFLVAVDASRLAVFLRRADGHGIAVATEGDTDAEPVALVWIRGFEKCLWVNRSVSNEDVGTPADVSEGWSLSQPVDDAGIRQSSSAAPAAMVLPSSLMAIECRASRRSPRWRLDVPGRPGAAARQHGARPCRGPYQPGDGGACAAPLSPIE